MADPILDQLDIIDAASAKIRAGLIGPPPAPPYTARTDRAILAREPFRPWGAAGSTQASDVYHNVVLRVTDDTLAEGRSWRVSSNAHTAGWNATSEVCFAMNAGGGCALFRYDAKPLNARLIGEPYSTGEPSFSRLDPDVLYTTGGAEGRTIRRYSLLTKAFTDVVDLDTLTPGLRNPRTYVHSLQVGGDPETLCVLYGGTIQDDDYLVLLWRSATAQAEIINSRTRFGCNLHGAMLDRTARFLLLYPRTADIALAGQVIVIDRQTGVATKAPRAGGHDAVGFGRWINQAESYSQPYDGAQWQARSLSTLSLFSDLIPTQLTPPVKLSDHPTWNNCTPANAEPFFTGLYRNAPEPGDPLVPRRAWEDEIIGVDATGVGLVYRFGQHGSIVLDEVDPSKLNFWAQPIANVSPDGNKIIWTSNQNRSLGAEFREPLRFRQDVFLMKLR